MEDSSLVLESLMEVFAGQPGFAVVGHARGEDEAFSLIRDCRPDVVILDLALSPGSGLNVLKRIRRADGLGTRVLVLPGGEAVGTLCVIDRVPRRLDATQRMALEILARSVVTELELRQRVVELETEVTRRQEAEMRIMHLATRDPLTGLPNRAALMDRLQQGIKTAKRDRSLMAVLFMDLDRFKWINDTLGHDVGDTLLQQIAGRLTHLLRDSDTVARLGGDEFAIILPSLHGAEEAERIAQKIIDSVLQPMTLRGHHVQVGCSIGLAIYPVRGETEEALLRHADLARYQAKESSGNQYQVFSEYMNSRAVERMTLESELRQAIDGGQLELHYQPQVRLSDQSLTGLEALVRWNHPRLGLLSPDRFIPLAEDSGLIWPLGLRVLEMAVAQTAGWIRQGLCAPRVAVNVAARR